MRLSTSRHNLHSLPHAALVFPVHHASPMAMLQSLTPGAYIAQFAGHSPTQLYRVAPAVDAAKYMTT